MTVLLSACPGSLYRVTSPLRLASSADIPEPAADRVVPVYDDLVNSPQSGQVGPGDLTQWARQNMPGWRAKGWEVDTHESSGDPADNDLGGRAAHFTIEGELRLGDRTVWRSGLFTLHDNGAAIAYTKEHLGGPGTTSFVRERHATVKSAADLEAALADFLARFEGGG